MSDFPFQADHGAGSRGGVIGPHGARGHNAANMIFKPLHFDRYAGHSPAAEAPAVPSDRFATPCGEGSSLRDYFNGLPLCGSGRELRDLIRRLAASVRGGRPLILGLGAAVLDEGVGPVIIDLLRRCVITGVAMTSEALGRDVAIALRGGFDTAERWAGAEQAGDHEAAELINEAAGAADPEQTGLGAAVGAFLAAPGNVGHGNLSILAAARELEVPVTVHVTIGTEAAHYLASCDIERLAALAHRDSRIFAAEIAALQGGVFLIGGSTATLPETFATSLRVVRSLGHRVDTYGAGFLGGTGGGAAERLGRRVAIEGENGVFFNIEGAYGLLYPLVGACLLDELSETC